MSSSIPTVIQAFQSLATSALPTGAQIVMATVLPAAYQPGPGGVATVSSGVTLQIMGVHVLRDEFAVVGPPYTHEEDYSIMCSLSAWAGDPDFKQRMIDVYSMYADLTIALANNPTLGLTTPAPRIAWPRQLDFSPAPDPFGRPAGTISFEVSVESRIQSFT